MTLAASVLLFVGILSPASDCNSVPVNQGQPVLIAEFSGSSGSLTGYTF